MSKQLKYIDSPLKHGEYQLKYDNISGINNSELSNSLKFWKQNTFVADKLFDPGVNIEYLWADLLDTGLSLANSYRYIAYLWLANYTGEDIGPVYFSDESNIEDKLATLGLTYFSFSAPKMESDKNTTLFQNLNLTSVTSLASENLTLILDLKYNVDNKGIEQPLAGFSDNTFSWNGRYLNPLAMLALALSYLTNSFIPDEDIITFIEDISTEYSNNEAIKTVILSDTTVELLTYVLIELNDLQHVDTSMFNRGTIIE